MFEKTIADNSFDSIFGIEDSIDAAIIGDEYVDEELANMKADADAGVLNTPISEELDGDEFSADEDEDIIDSDMDYEEDLSDPDPVESDAIDYIEAEKELIKNPFEEDETIDIAINGDLPSDLE